MSQINYEIPKQNFELIEERIGVILTTELERQLSVFYNTDADGVTVYMERSNPIDHTELAVINVKIAEGDYTMKHQGNVQGPYTYHIEVFTNSKTKNSGAGDTLSALRRNRLVGLCRAILEDTVYKTLGFTPGGIAGTRVVGFKMGAMKGGENDMLNTMAAQLTFEVRSSERVELQTGEELLEAFTQVRLYETEFGYQYQYNE